MESVLICENINVALGQKEMMIVYVKVRLDGKHVGTCPRQLQTLLPCMCTDVFTDSPHSYFAGWLIYFCLLIPYLTSHPALSYLALG